MPTVCRRFCLTGTLDSVRSVDSSSEACRGKLTFPSSLPPPLPFPLCLPRRRTPACTISHNSPVSRSLANLSSRSTEGPNIAFRRPEPRPRASHIDCRRRDENATDEKFNSDEAPPCGACNFLVTILYAFVGLFPLGSGSMPADRREDDRVREHGSRKCATRLDFFFPLARSSQDRFFDRKSTIARNFAFNARALFILHTH